MWNYTSAGDPDPDLFKWFVFPMLDNQNYTTKLVMGSEISRLEAYFTASEIPPDEYKCSLYDDEGARNACISVSAIQTQFQVAFPYISLAFNQDFSFGATSAGTYNNAPLGLAAWANCSIANCTGLGLATVYPDGQRIYQNDLFALMPRVEKNTTGIYEWALAPLEGKQANHAAANVPRFTFWQVAAPPVCDSEAADPDAACQAVKASATGDDKALQNTAAVCKKNTCVFEPPLSIPQEEIGTRPDCSVSNGG